MCGRFVFTASEQDVFNHFNLNEINAELKQSYNIAPNTVVSIICQHQNHRQLLNSRWGFLPHWANDQSKPQINARAETVHEKPFFRESFKLRRCLIPLNGWYEWQAEVGQKQPFYFMSKEQPLLAMAGIWSVHQKDNIREHNFCVLTTAAQSGLTEIHARMPVIIAPEHFDLWLDENAKPHGLTSLMTATKPGFIKKHRVSQKVSSVRINDASCIMPVDLAHIMA